jgi:hypothetical protein
MQPLDNLIPAGTTVVVLDTSPARNLAYTNAPPPWVITFAEMALDGYSFSLADNAFAELISQIASEAITEVQASRMLGQLKTFLNSSLPIFPGKRDIYALIGSNEKAVGWSIEQILALSTRSWEFLNLATKGEPLSAENDLQTEREAWFAIFEKLGKSEVTDEPLNEYEHRQLTIALNLSDSSASELSPPLSVRWDLQMRLLWRQYVRSKKTSEPYDPTSQKKRNDGIDFDIFHYLLLPALVVSTDSGFFEKLADIKSYQTAWFWKPEDLAQAWSDGKRPHAKWP